MRAFVQRVKYSSVKVDEENYFKEIQGGFNVLLGVKKGDTRDDADRLIKKISSLRVFSDAEGKMNLSLKDVGGSILLISQFTLYADTSKGNRPSFIGAACYEEGKSLYEYTARGLAEYAEVKCGIYGADMSVTICNDGPVSIMLES